MAEIIAPSCVIVGANIVIGRQSSAVRYYLADDTTRSIVFTLKYSLLCNIDLVEKLKKNRIQLFSIDQVATL